MGLTERRSAPSLPRDPRRAERLGVDRFSVRGRSAGGPYALACAVRLESKIDREVINRPDLAPRLQHAYVEAARSGGSRGLAEDMRVVLAPWGFDPAEILAPAFVFHGRRDAIAPPTHAEHWIETLPDARPAWFEDAGHLLIEDHVEAILDALAVSGK